MPITIIAGAQWGDEGKGKLVDALTADGEIVVRFQGGANAGHSILTDAGRFALHLLPAGVLRRQTTNLIASGVALDVPCLQEELRALERAGVEAPDLRISDRARLVLDSHRRMDACEEELLGEKSFGSTRRGIAPLYAAKALKIAIPVGLCADEDALAAAVDRWLGWLSSIFPARYGQPPPLRAAVMAEARAAHAAVADRLCDSGRFLREAIASGRRIIGEAQLGALRDIDHGVIPWTTSTSTLASALASSAGVPSQAIGQVIAAVKCYSSCVGAGPLVTELHGLEAQHLRRFGHERGTTTGRERRVGWFDLVASRHGCDVQCPERLALTMLDVLSGLERIPICIAYRCGAQVFERLPPAHLLGRCQPVYRDVAGWSGDLGACRSWKDLPDAAKEFIRTLSAGLGRRIGWISTGPHRDQLVEIKAQT